MPKTFSLTGEPSRIAERIRQSQLQSFILVVPTKRRMRHLTRQLLLNGSQYSLSEPLLFTLGVLAQRIAQTAFADKRLLDEPVQLLLFHQAILEVRNQLGYFRVRSGYPAVPPGTFEKIINVIRKLKETGVMPATLAEEIAADDREEQTRLQDIYLIYSAYENRLRAMNAYDETGIFRTLVVECSESLFRRSFERLFPLAKEIAIVGFNEFTEPEMGFVQRLCSLSLPVALEFDFELGNPALFGQLEHNYRRFCDLGFRPAHRIHSDDTSLDPFRTEHGDSAAQQIHRHLARTLFRQDQAHPKKNCRDVITVARTPDRVREVQYICSLIKHLALQDPQRDLSRICVAMYRPQLYTPIMREQFRKFGIPANITDRYELAQSPVVTAIMGLLDIAARGFLRDEVIRTLSSSYFDFGAYGEPIDPSNLLEISREARITGGLATWHTRIERRLQRLRQLPSDEEDERATRSRKRNIERYEKAQRDMQTLEQLLTPLKGDQTPRAFSHNVQILLETLRLPARLIAGGNSELTELVERDARAYAKFLDVLELTIHLLEFQEGKSTTRPVRAYVEQLKIALSQERYNVRERHGHGVLVTSIEETRGLPIELMIVAGLVDGEFPSVYQSELFFSARRLKEREQRHRWENRYLFYQAVTNWSQHLYLTYPEQEADIDLVRSTFLDALAAVAEVEYVDTTTSPLSAAIYSEERFLQRYGDAVGTLSQPGFDVPPSLLEKASRVKTAIAVDRSRVENHNLPEYEGRIFAAVSDETRAWLAQLPQRVYSVSQLESYGKCPYQFFVNRLLRVSAPEELDEDLSPVEKGTILHDILFEFYTERREQNLPPLMQCSDEQFASAYQRLISIAEEKLAQYDIPGAFWELEKELILGDKHSGRGLLYEFLHFERARSASVTPSYFEVGFGSELGPGTRKDATLSQEEPVVVGAVRLKGKVDRVEVDDEVFVVLDYKAGAMLPSLSDIRAGRSLQLPLYLHAIASLLDGSRRPVGAAYYQLRRPITLKLTVGTRESSRVLGISKRGKATLTDKVLQNMITEAISCANRYVAAMAEGNFPLTTNDNVEKACTYCEYKRMCRIQTLRQLSASRSEE